MKEPVVLVIVSYSENGSDLDIVIASHLKPTSPIITLKGAARWVYGNPYGVYGDAIADYLKVDKFSVSIRVFKCTSGCLVGW